MFGQCVHVNLFLWEVLVENVWKGFIVVSCCCFFSACAPQSYVDPQYHKANYEDIQRSDKPIRTKVTVHFQRNGAPLPAVDSEVQGHVERTLRASNVFLPTTENAEANIEVTANNIADLATARAKGFKTGFTFYAAGSMVDDNYEITYLFFPAEGNERKYSYEHAIHTAIGRTERPVGLTPTTTADAFAKVMEDSTLNFLKDLQNDGFIKQ